ncbi:MAG: hypothetical protein ACT4N4_16560 [Rhodospirillales bacterium]
MQSRRRLMGGALGLAGYAAFPLPGIAAGADPVDQRFRAVPKHLQVFRTPPADWPQAAALCKRLGISTIAVAIPPAERQRLLADRAAAERTFAPLAASGLNVRCMVGEGAWSRSRGGLLPAPVDELLALHDRAFRFEALLLDVEPQVLPEWKRGERAPLVRGTLLLFEAARAACARRGMRLAAALAPWYTKTPDPDRPGATFLDGCLERLDEALIMAYRNEPGAAAGFARDALAAVALKPRPCWIGLTTQGNDAPGSTYFGLGAKRFMGDVAELYEKLKLGPAGPHIAGIAIHQYATLRSMFDA